MFSKFLKINSIIVLSCLSLVFSSQKSTKATSLEKQAHYQFYFDDESLGGGGAVYLTYTDIEEPYLEIFTFFVTSLNPPFKFSDPETIEITGDILFDINESGLLVGVYGNGNEGYNFGDDKYCHLNNSCIFGNGSYSLLLNGDQYTISHTINSREYTGLGDLIGESTYTYLEHQGTIIFDQIQPIVVIPEPLTILGAITAIGFGTLFKKLQ